MLTREGRAAASAKWLAHWRGWQSCGVSVAEYARREGFDVDAAYRWRRILRRTGQWIEGDGGVAPSAARKSKAAVRFARVAVSHAPTAAAMLLRVALRNGRHAELELHGSVQLGEVLEVLERAA